MYLVQIVVSTTSDGLRTWATRSSHRLPGPAIADAKKASGGGDKVRVLDDSSSGPNYLIVWESWNPILPYWSAGNEPPRKPTDAELDKVAEQVFDEIQEVNIPVYVAISRAKTVKEAQELTSRYLQFGNLWGPPEMRWRGSRVLEFAQKFDGVCYLIEVNSVFDGLQIVVFGNPLHGAKDLIKDQYRRALTACI